MRHVVANTSQWGRPYSQGFRKRKTGVRRWRQIITRDTEAKQHYRSVQEAIQPMSGAALVFPRAAVFLIPALNSTDGFIEFAANPFWTGGNGGAQDPDWATALPVFASDIILRGGIARISITNTEDINIRVKCYALWSHTRPWMTIYSTINNTNASFEWDPSIVPDFSTRFAKTLYMREVMLKPNDSFEMVHRFKPQKIDRLRFAGAAGEPQGNTLWWGVALASMQANTLSNAVQCVTSYNVSFSGDAQ